MRREKTQISTFPDSLCLVKFFFLDDRTGEKENFGAIIRLDGLGGCPKTYGKP